MQPSEGYFFWDTDPVLFTIPELELPVAISVWGLLLAAALFWAFREKIIPGDESPVAAWKPWGLALITFLAGQLPFLLISGPSIESIGPITPRWYGLMFACAFIFGYLHGAKLLKEGGRTQEEIDRLLIYLLISTVVGARLGHIIFYDLNFYLQNPEYIPAIWRGGLASHGAAIAIILGVWLYVRKTPKMSFLWLADRVAPSIAIGGIFIRVGNFFNSEILGEVTDLPWAVIFARIDLLPRHPSMLYESISCILVLTVLLFIYYRYDKKPPEGALFGTFLAMLFTGRFLIEFTKINQAEFEAALILNMGQLLSIPLILIGVWLILKRVNWKKHSN